MSTTRIIRWLMVAAGVAGCAGQAHRSHSIRVGHTVLVCEQKLSARFSAPASCIGVDRAELRQLLVAPPR